MFSDGELLQPAQCASCVLVNQGVHGHRPPALVQGLLDVRETQPHFLLTKHVCLQQPYAPCGGYSRASGCVCNLEWEPRPERARRYDGAAEGCRWQHWEVWASSSNMPR